MEEERQTALDQAESKNATPFRKQVSKLYHEQESGNEDIPTMVNSTGIRWRRIK